MMDDIAKYKQIAFKIGIPLAILVFIIFLIITGSSSGSNDDTNNKENSEMSLFDEDELIGTRYTDSVEDKLNDAVDSQDDLKDDNKKMKEEIDLLKKMILKQNDLSKQTYDQKANDNLYKSFPSPDTPGINSQISNAKDNILEKPPKVVYKVMSNIDTTSTIDQNFGKVKEKKPTKDLTGKKTKKIYIPTTAITQGELLHGLNLPTQMSKPMSVPVMINDFAFLPSEKKLDLKKCNLLVEGYGQLSDERGYFRFVQFVCYGKDGQKVYDTPASGYLTSLTDNKKGLAGHVVSKQNEMLKRMFYAGAIEGATNIFANAGETTITSALGTTTQDSSSNTDKAKNVIGGGLASASESAKELYLDKAKNIFEVLEVLKQDVGLVFTEGLILEPLDLDKKGTPNDQTDN